MTLGVRNQRAQKRKVLSLLVLQLVLICGGCTKTVQSKSAETMPGDVILIGEVDSMTGNEATFGQDTNRGATLAIEEANEKGGIRGSKIILKSSDVQNNADEGARAISKLINQDKVVAILTGATSSNAMAMAPISQQGQIPIVASAATNPKLTQLGDYIFRACFTDRLQGKIMARFTAENLHLKKVAIIRDIRSDASVGLAHVFETQFKALGGEVIMDQSYSSGDIDFRSQLTAIRGKKPEALFVPGYYTDVSLIARQARELGIDIPLLGADGWDSPKLKEIGGSALAGSYFSNFYSPDDPSPKVKNFAARYRKKYGMDPDGSAAMGYETANLLIDALRRAPSFQPKAIRDALAATQGLETLNGKLSIDAERNATKSAVVLKVDSDGSPKYWTIVNP